MKALCIIFLLTAATFASEDATSQFQVAPGFKLERVYQVPQAQGSWVAMTVDGKGRFICGDQYGKIYRVEMKDGEVAKVEAIPTKVGGAHGLLWHRGVLYVSVNEAQGGESGVWRMEEKGEFYAEPMLVKPMNGRGEHGPHSMVASPDGEWIYFIAGNHTNLAEMDRSMPTRSWGEDQLLPRNPDGRGHARDRMAPGGWISRFKPDGTQWELVSIGYRNAYDIAFNDRGDLFAYDADMEWDFGMPWYRPTRICHAIPGSEFGWRNGTGKWPAFYEDSMPAVLDIGPGSPTGLLSGKGLAFPAKYQKALYALDWTFATIHIIHLKPDGSTYAADREELVAGSGLPLTDAVVGPDGAFYFTTGGRKTASCLWRVTYVGKDPVARLPSVAIKTHPLEKPLIDLVHEGKAPDGSDLAMAWRALDSADRAERARGRILLEALPAAGWIARLADESSPWRVITGSIGAARCGSKPESRLALAALLKLDWKILDPNQKLGWLRAAGLVFIRGGNPDEAERGSMIGKIDAAFPSGDATLDFELCRMLCYLQAPGIVPRTLALMKNQSKPELPNWTQWVSRNENYGKDIAKMLANHPPTAQVHYVYCLREVKGPWKAEEREEILSWFREVSTREGGKSYGGFLEGIKSDLMANATPEERARFMADAAAPAEPVLANLPPVEGPGRAWTVTEIESLAANGLDGRDLARGKRMFQASLCSACHRLGGEGGASGPDLNALGGRFTAKDIAEAILEPSKVVSDQYAFDSIRKHDGTVLTGKILNEQDELLVVASNPFDLSQTAEIPRSDVKEITLSPVSPMPGALINRLNPEELKDLLAYLMGRK